MPLVYQTQKGNDMPRPLFDITQDLVQLNDLLDDIEGDTSRWGEMEPAITAWMDGLAVEEDTKLDSYVHLVKQLEMEAAAAKAEAEQYAMKARTRENRAKWLKERLKLHLEATGRTKVETRAKRVIAIQKNGGKAPLVLDANVELDVLALSRPALVKTTLSLNTEAVREALEEGEKLDFAFLSPVGTHLRIR